MQSLYSSSLSRELNKHILRIISKNKDTRKSIKSKSVTTLLHHLADYFCEKGEALTALPFGSFETGTSTKDGDIDICLVFPEHLFAKATPTLEEQQNIVQQIVNGVEKKKLAPGFKVISYYIACEVPYAKLFHNKNNVFIDVSLDMIGVMNTRMLKTYMELDIRIRPFIMFIKLWASSWGIVGSGGKPYLRSFTFNLLAIAYLQEIEFIPSLQQLVSHPLCDHEKDLGEPPHSVDGKDTRFFANTDSLHKVWKGPTNENTRKEFASIGIDELLKGFFGYFAQLDFTACVIDISVGKIQKRTEPKSGEADPLMSIVGPFDRIDKGRVVESKQYEETVNAFRNSNNLVTQNRPWHELIQQNDTTKN